MNWVLCAVGLVLGLIVTTVLWGMTRDDHEDDPTKATCHVGSVPWFAGCFWLGVSLITHTAAKLFFKCYDWLDGTYKWVKAHAGGWLGLVVLGGILVAYRAAYHSARLSLDATVWCQARAIACAIEGGAEA